MYVKKVEESPLGELLCGSRCPDLPFHKAAPPLSTASTQHAGLEEFRPFQTSGKEYSEAFILVFYSNWLIIRDFYLNLQGEGEHIGLCFFREHKQDFP
ncbi:hypothetical protein HMPREF9141_1221 [Prevotella multiformis DSM 16608]|uniref:Uncharacterized protein n=1 Tax=Prevotella multiformis DSM 16608 TaxID=888743 RepID=F0F6J9_9BACT|nr:hypothetical protein HMPREF9141_1221 [Prevotella multiformis DSM 16608]